MPRPLHRAGALGQPLKFGGNQAQIAVEIPSINPKAE